MEDKKSKTPLQGRLIEIDGVQYQLIEGKLYRYANLTMDKAFKIVLGRVGSEEVLKRLLNRMLGTCIVRLQYRNTEYPGLTEEESSSRFDVYCEDETGNCFEIEMQNWSQRYFNKRAVYYSALVMHDQAEKARQEARRKKIEWDYGFKPLYVVSFLNYRNWTSESLGEKRSEFISLYRYRDVETGEELGDGTNIVFIDLYGFKKTLEDCESLEDFWMYSIKNMFKLNSCPEIVRGTEIEELYRLSELAKMSLEQRIKIEEEVMTQNDIRNSIAEQLEDAKKEAVALGREEGLIQGKAEGRAEGRAEGWAEGRAEGWSQAIREMAVKMSVAGVDVGVISQTTGLTEVEIKSLL